MSSSNLKAEGRIAVSDLMKEIKEYSDFKKTCEQKQQEYNTFLEQKRMYDEQVQRLQKDFDDFFARCEDDGRKKYDLKKKIGSVIRKYGYHQESLELKSVVSALKSAGIYETNAAAFNNLGYYAGGKRKTRKASKRTSKTRKH